MELNVFIKESLCQIIDGVKGAQEYAGQKGAIINPINFQPAKEWQAGMFNKEVRVVSNIDFEVGLTQSGGSSAGIGVYFGEIVVGAKGETSSKTVSATSIRFSVPVVLPSIKEQE
jgi:hypothetical protein